MNCIKWQELASEYQEGTLPRAQQDALRAHLATCADCAAAQRDFAAAWESLSELPPVQPPLFLHENILAAVEREAIRAEVPWWQSLRLPQIGQAAIGAALATGVVAAALWRINVPATPPGEASPSVVATNTRPGAVSGPLTGGPLNGGPLAGALLPGSGASGDTSAATSATAESSSEMLNIARMTSLSVTEGPSYDFTFWLDPPRARGTVRFEMLQSENLRESITAPYRFNLRGDVAQTLRVPLRALPSGQDVLALRAVWTAEGAGHTRYLLVPVPRTDQVPAERQSFGLPAGTLLEAAHEIAHRYGVPVTLSDVAPQTPVAVTASEDTAAGALQKALAESRVQVTASGTGVLLQPAATR